MNWKMSELFQLFKQHTLRAHMSTGQLMSISSSGKQRASHSCKLSPGWVSSCYKLAEHQSSTMAGRSHQWMLRTGHTVNCCLGLANRRQPYTGSSCVSLPRTLMPPVLSLWRILSTSKHTSTCKITSQSTVARNLATVGKGDKVFLFPQRLVQKIKKLHSTGKMQGILLKPDKNAREVFSIYLWHLENTKKRGEW